MPACGCYAYLCYHGTQGRGCFSLSTQCFFKMFCPLNNDTVNICVRRNSLYYISLYIYEFYASSFNMSITNLYISFIFLHLCWWQHISFDEKNVQIEILHLGISYKTKDARHSLCFAFNPIVVSTRNKWDEEISQLIKKKNSNWDVLTPPEKKAHIIC